jgi:hypothetical protein
VLLVGAFQPPRQPGNGILSDFPDWPPFPKIDFLVSQLDLVLVADLSTVEDVEDLAASSPLGAQSTVRSRRG